MCWVDHSAKWWGSFDGKKKNFFTYLPTHYLEGRVTKGETNNFLRLPLSNNSHKPITNTTWVCALLCKLQKRVYSTRNRKWYSLPVACHGRWFSPGTPASSTTKTGHHDIAEILLKVALNTNKFHIAFIYYWNCSCPEYSWNTARWMLSNNL
jgi:hypothetical protein